MARSIKEIDAEIKALEKEREEIKYQELARKYSSILDALEESSLSVAKANKVIVAAIAVADPSVAKKIKASDSEKIVKNSVATDSKKQTKKEDKPK